MHSKLTAAQMVALRDEGVSVREIAERAGVRAATVYYHLKRAAEGPAPKAPDGPSRLSRGEMMVLHTQGVPVTEIAERAGIAVYRAYYHIRRAKAGHPEGWHERKSKLTPEQIAQQYHYGVPVGTLAREAGVGPERVRQVLRDLGVELRRATQPTKRRISAAEMVHLHQEGLSLQEIAQQAGVTPQCVSQVLLDMGYSALAEDRERRGLARAVKSFSALWERTLLRNETLLRWKQAYELACTGLTDVQIAETIDVAHGTSVSRMGRQWAERQNLPWPLKLKQ